MALGDSGAQSWRIQVRRLRGAEYKMAANKTGEPVGGGSWCGKCWEPSCTLIDSRSELDQNLYRAQSGQGSSSGGITKRA